MDPQRRISPSSTPEAARTRSRAKKACKVCNSRRIRCNVMDEQPCSNCRSADLHCELIQSRRGKYPRHPNHTKLARPKVPESPVLMAPRFPESNVRDSRNDNSEYKSTHPAPQILSPVRTVVPGETGQGTSASPVFSISPPTTASPTSTMNGAESTVFLGESSSISLVHSTQNASSASRGSTRDRTRYPIPDAVNLKAPTTPFEARRKSDRIEYLEKDGAFAFPSNDICEVLFGAYFSWFHPCFPILDRLSFYNSYITKTISPLLFQAVLFVGATHCNAKTMKELGFSDRQDTRNAMYNHAKDIYDADYETDKIIVSQALFLMSFWRADPLLEKDTRHWLGAAISLAQTKGMHRSSSTTFSDGKLRKRIWWSLYVRDRQCSSALGLPTRIRDEDCDIGMLEPSDFEDVNYSTYPKYLGIQLRDHVLYAIQMARLAIYLGKIVLREFSPNSVPRPESERSKLKDDLAIWESELSPEMGASATSYSFWASMLHLSYNNLYILLYRSAYLGAQEGAGQDIGNIALQAACRNTRIIEDVLTQELVQNSNVSITTSLFNSLCIHTICLRRSTQPTTRKLAEYRAQLCLLGLRELQKTWDVTNWVLQLFLQFLDQSTAKKLQLAAENEDFMISMGPAGARAAVGSPGGGDAAVVVVVAGDVASGAGLSGSMQSPILRRIDDVQAAPMLDFASYLFGTKEAEDFSMFQLQPDLFSGDGYWGGLDQYYNSMGPRGDTVGGGQ